MTQWPLRDWLRLSVKVLGLSPEQFWDMTISDFLTLIAHTPPNSASHSDLNALLEHYPDEVNNGTE